MNLNIQARLVNSETKKVHCFKHAVLDVINNGSNFDFELDDFDNYISAEQCVVCHPEPPEIEFGWDEDEEREVGNEIPILGLKPRPETVEEITKEEIKTKGFSIKSKKKGKFL